MGYVEHAFEAYNQIDIGINPVRWGSGIKIKTLELLGHGIPTVVTSEGGRGLDDINGSVFLCADDPLTFANHIDTLINDYELRLSLSEKGYEYIRLHYPEENCYQILIDILRNKDSI